MRVRARTSLSANLRISSRIASSVSSRPGIADRSRALVLADQRHQPRAMGGRVARARSASRPRGVDARAICAGVRPSAGSRTISPWLIGMPPKICAQIFADADRDEQFLGLAEAALGLRAGRHRRQIRGPPRHRWRARRGRGRRAARASSSARRSARRPMTRARTACAASATSASMAASRILGERQPGRLDMRIGGRRQSCGASGHRLCERDLPECVAVQHGYRNAHMGQGEFRPGVSCDAPIGGSASRGISAGRQGHACRGQQHAERPASGAASRRRGDRPRTATAGGTR